MSVTQRSSGAQAATLNTEHSLDIASAVAGVFRARVDCSAMVAGDITEIRVYEKARAADTKQVSQLYRIRGPLASPMQFTIAVEQTVYHEVTLKQVGGTGRTYPWCVFAA